ncbi:hypothetical protein SAMN05216525_104124 [Bradyrhizobium sp. Gha]|nr:hypothetical protein SAMN05216525_104124 [Bradyrhizobium sp. Gha]
MMRESKARTGPYDRDALAITIAEMNCPSSQLMGAA